MRALLVVRASGTARPGSDTVRAELAARALRAISVDATVVASEQPDARGFDVAHVFGIAEPASTARQIAAVRAAGVPVALTPIWFDPSPYLAVAPGVERALGATRSATVERRLQRARETASDRFVAGRSRETAAARFAVERSLLLAADIVIATGEIEAFLYGDRLGITRLAYTVAPLGVDDEAFAVDRPAVRSGVLCVGRIDSRTNQAALLYALHDVDVDVTLVGPAADAAYLALCKRWATPRTRFVGAAPNDEVLRMMSRAAVHARPAWLDAPSLASLEAAATGARIVSGDRGCEREYFGPSIDYADPSDPASIRVSVLRAIERPPRDRGDALDRRLGAQTWERHAQLTIEAYARAIAGTAS